MSTFSEIRALFGIAPKTLDQAKGTLETAGTKLDAVAGLFSSAGLNIDTMLSAGPDSLKAHIASFGDSEAQLSDANAKLNELKNELAESAKQVESANAKAKAACDVFAMIGASVDSKPEDFKAKLDAYVSKAATLELAKSGHAPIATVPETGNRLDAVAPAANASREDHYAYLTGLPEAERSAYFAKYLKRAHL